eukprot:Polyplicarium_translucidae@DN2744_c0_g1_i5.p2
MERRNVANWSLLGHVDCGKTSLVKSLLARCEKSVASTCSLDKHPESQRRGITIDLGFAALEFGDRCVCLVDCPGHASLAQKVIAGAHIIDGAMLVIDASKGIQAQTIGARPAAKHLGPHRATECIVLAEIFARDIMVVLNKVDLLPRDR